MRSPLWFTVIFCSVFCLPAAHAQTEIKPLWEVGAGAAFIDFPIYRGADERRSYLLPVPYFAYMPPLPRQFRANSSKLRNGGRQDARRTASKMLALHFSDGRQF